MKPLKYYKRLNLIALGLNVLIWLIWWFKVKSDPNPFFFASGVLAVNFVLSGFLIHKQLLSAYFIMGTTIAIQVLTFIFLAYLWRGGVR